MTDTSAVAGISVIVVEDDADLREEVMDCLEDNGMRVRGAGSGAELEQALAERPADIVVLDLGLPQEDGIDLCRRLRARGDPVGIVMVSARARVEERILGYDTGADVYLVKPVDFGELVATIRATHRHLKARLGEKSLSPPEDPLAWRLNLVTWQLAAPSGAAVKLTRAETQALGRITEAPGVPVSRDEIGVSMGKVPDLGEHRYVDQVISRLRRKISSGLGWEAPIGSAHGQGYFFSAAVERIED